MKVKSDGEGVEALPIGDYFLKAVRLVPVSSNQFGEIFGGTPHLKKDHTQFGILTRQRG